MQRLLITLVAVLLFDATAFAAEPKEWKVFEEPTGRFTISLPTTPTPREVPVGGGTKEVHYQCKSEDLNCHFNVRVTHRPTLNKRETIEKFYDDLAADIRDDPMVKSLHTTQFKWKGRYPAFDFTTVPSNGTDDTVDYTYLVVTPRDVIMIDITGPKATVQGKQIADCLNSLTIKE